MSYDPVRAYKPSLEIVQILRENIDMYGFCFVAGVFFTILFSPSQGLGRTAIQFFKSPQSQFASGQTNLRNLQKKIISTEYHHDLLVESQLRSQWVSAQEVARFFDLSQSIQFENQNWNILNQENSWLWVENPLTHHKKWVSIEQINENPKDLGLAMTLISTTLREKPTWKSPTIITVPEKTKLKIEKWDGSWARVQFFSGSSFTTGYVDINNLLLKFDFAKQVQTNNQSWHDFIYREGQFIVLANKKMIPLTEVTAIKVQPQLGVMLQSIRDKKLLLRQNVLIKKTESQVWAKSQLKGHGIVYWKYQIPKAKELPILTQEQLLKREIYSVAWDPKNPAYGLVSTYGIYFTEDGGKTWSQIAQFKNENHPLEITPQGVWLVGSFRSQDRGQNFTPYIRMDKLTHVLQTQTKNPPRILKLSDIKYYKNYLQIEVDTGTKSYRLATKSPLHQIVDWDILLVTNMSRSGSHNSNGSHKSH
jgi:hypothetical protein